jgi:hypothetical protein
MSASAELGISQIAYSPLAQECLRASTHQAGYRRQGSGGPEVRKWLDPPVPVGGASPSGSRACSKSPRRPACHSLSLPSPECFITAMSRRP